MTIAVFIIFVGIVLFIATRASRRASGVGGYFVANNSIHWGINGVAFAGGYLSVASFLGICGLIAFFGYDGFLYSIGFLAGWIIALFVIAEPLKRMGTYTFSDALNHTFQSRGIHLAAGLSVLVVSLFYLVPQMVGAGVLIEPLLGIPHHWGVVIVGTVIILIVVSGGMTSTTYVQFFNGGLLLIFATILTGAVLIRGINTSDQTNAVSNEKLGNFVSAAIGVYSDGSAVTTDLPDAQVLGRHAVLNRWTGAEELVFYQLSRSVPAVIQDDNKFMVMLKGHYLMFQQSDEDAWSMEQRGDEWYVRIEDWWRLDTDDNGKQSLVETQFRSVLADGKILINGVPESNQNKLLPMGGVAIIPEKYKQSTGTIGPLRLLSIFSDPSTIIQRPKQVAFATEGGDHVTIYYEEATRGSTFMRPGLMFPIEPLIGEPKTTTFLHRLNFISLMLALFLGTAALPHILIRYYTVPDAESARKSTIIAITGIGIFYILTMFLGVGAVANGALNPANSNMSAPLLARSFGEVLFAMVSAVAFTTVLATVSGLIMAASGAVAHDLMGNIRKREVSDSVKVKAGRRVAIIVGVIGIALGILFREVNVSFLVGWAFAVAASANLPSLVMMLFWKKVTAPGIISSILVGIFSSVILVLLNPDMWARYGLDPNTAPMPINQPGIISIPLSFVVLVIVSLMTQKKGNVLE